MILILIYRKFQIPCHWISSQDKTQNFLQRILILVVKGERSME